ncbi:GNAT family N-acetyltransferase [Sediminicurvatus halobius]|uniref:N-acetyltransferase domain-containing protein n=1 Tax=Sediminicurvatus halobius TaxID=2182432 RepID=A0A2U2N4J7_9GAMM|nr:GNAT family N-acetyltransferase [Spiribacter halobius]PWG63889.1 hypothetical protein DEM34_06725 [Spiribacter halobius]UEX76299.1 GNAT family N-acetyltransferase [Spiribacter halobius]
MFTVENRQQSPADGPHLCLRPACGEDVAALRAMHILSVLTLCARDYSGVQLAAFLSDFDTTAPDCLEAGRLLVATLDGALVGSGGWQPTGQMRCTREGVLPEVEIRALYVHPAAAGRGVGGRIYEHLEQAAAAEGHAGSLVLRSTLTAERFYARRGFRRIERTALPLREGIAFPVVRMAKALHLPASLEPMEGRAEQRAPEPMPEAG